MEIRAAAQKAEMASNASDGKMFEYWAKKEEQLRNKEEQLRKKEEQLRNEKGQLRKKEEQLREMSILQVRHHSIRTVQSRPIDGKRVEILVWGLHARAVLSSAFAHKAFP